VLEQTSTSIEDAALFAQMLLARQSFDLPCNALCLRSRVLPPKFYFTCHDTYLIGTHNHGQGHETTFAQIVGEKLGVPFENIDIVFGDTDKVQFGMGTYGSRSVVVGGPALAKASDKVIAKGKKIAAHLLEASEQDITFERGTFSVIGTDRKKTLADIALAAYVPHDYPLETLEPGLEEQAYYDPNNFSFPGGAHVAEVEIDPDTEHAAQLCSAGYSYFPQRPFEKTGGSKNSFCAVRQARAMTPSPSSKVCSKSF